MDNTKVNLRKKMIGEKTKTFLLEKFNRIMGGLKEGPKEKLNQKISNQAMMIIKTRNHLLFRNYQFSLSMNRIRRVREPPPIENF
jgi:hypothetical protein